MNIDKLRKIKKIDKLRKRLPALLKELSFAKKKLNLTQHGSKKHKMWSNKYNIIQEKVDYISSKVGNKVEYPKITQGQRGSGYSARELGVSSRQLREGNVNVQDCAKLQQIIEEGKKQGKSPQEIKSLLEKYF